MRAIDPNAAGSLVLASFLADAFGPVVFPKQHPWDFSPPALGG